LELTIQVRMLRGPSAGTETTQSFVLGDGEGVTVGRSQGCALLVAHPTVTAEHCKVSLSAGVLWIEDLNSENGTFVNERRIQHGRKAMVQPGDVVRVGPAILCFGAADVPATQGSGTSTHSLAIEFVQQVMESGAERPPTIEVTVGPAAGLQVAVPRGRVIVIGRDPGCHAFVDDPDISHRHAKLYTDAEGCWLTDLHSRNGTRVDGRAIAGHWQLQSGQVIETGSTSIVFVDPAEEYLKLLDAGADVAAAAVADGSPEAKVMNHEGDARGDDVSMWGGVPPDARPSLALESRWDRGEDGGLLQGDQAVVPSGLEESRDRGVADEAGAERHVGAGPEAPSKGLTSASPSESAVQQRSDSIAVRAVDVSKTTFNDSSIWKWWAAGAVGVLFVLLAIGGLLYLFFAA